MRNPACCICKNKGGVHTQADQGLCFQKCLISIIQHMSNVVRKPAFCICENKDADQLRHNREADQRLCFSLHGLTCTKHFARNTGGIYLIFRP